MKKLRYHFYINKNFFLLFFFILLGQSNVISQMIPVDNCHNINPDIMPEVSGVTCDDDAPDINVDFDQMMGINLRRADRIEFATCVTQVREYHQWELDEIGVYPNNKYRFRPSNQEESQLTSFDRFYRELRELGLTICATLTGASHGVSGHSGDNCSIYDVAEPPSYNLGIDPNYCDPNPNIICDDDENVETYRWRGDYVTQFVNRYGENPDVPLNPGFEKNEVPNFPAATSNSRGLVTYLENWNEQDQWWLTEPHPNPLNPIFSPAAYATMSKVDFNGDSPLGSFQAGFENCGDDYPIGFDHLQSNIKYVMGGLSKLDEQYLINMADEFPLGTFPFDVLNFHHYSDEQYPGPGVGFAFGVSPEKDFLQEQLKRLDLLRDRDFPGTELWLSEFGYSTTPHEVGGVISPSIANLYLAYIDPATIPDGNEQPDIYEIQGQWIVRSFLAAAAADIDKAFVYEIRDYPHTPIGQWIDKCGLLESADHGFAPKKSWYYTSALKNILTGYDYKQQMNLGSTDCGIKNPRVYRFNDGNSDIYAIWSPTQCGETYEYEFDIGVDLEVANAYYYKLDVPSTTGIVENIVLGNNNNIALLPVSERPIFLVVDGERPDKVPCVENFMLTNVTCSSVNLFWDIPFDPTTGDPVEYDHYQIWYGPVSPDPGVGIHPDRLAEPDIFLDNITILEHDLPGDRKQAFVGGLESGVNYAFYVVPHIGNNAAGWCTGPNLDPNPIQQSIPFANPDDNCDIQIIDDWVTVYTDPELQNLWTVVNPWNTSTANQLFDRKITNAVSVDCCNLSGGVIDNEFEHRWTNEAEFIHVDLQQPHDINVIYLYDGLGVGSITVEYFDGPVGMLPTDIGAVDYWVPFINDHITNEYLIWKAFANDIPACQEIQHLRIFAGELEDAFAELVICGKPMTFYDDIANTPATYPATGCGDFLFTSDKEHENLRHCWDTDGDGKIDKIGAEITLNLTVNGLYEIKHIVKNLCNEIEFIYEVEVDCQPVNACAEDHLMITEDMLFSEAITQQLLVSPSNAGIAQNIYIGPDVTLTLEPNSSYVFGIGTAIIMDAGARIEIADNAVLQVWGTTIEGCSNLHRGILVNLGGTLAMFQESIMEDAEFGVELMANSTAIIVDCQFRNNYIGIESNSAGDGPTLTVTGTEFHCLDCEDDPILPEYNGQTTDSGSYTFAGIRLNGPGDFNIGSNSNRQNNFHDMHIGISSRNTTDDCVIQNNEFRDMSPIDDSYINTASLAILSLWGSVEINNNFITDCIRGILINRSDAEIIHNIIEFVEVGIDVVSIFPNDVNIFDNEISIERQDGNQFFGIRLNAATNPLHIDVNDNEVDDENAQDINSWGIFATTPAPSTPFFSINTYQIQNNDIDLYRGTGIEPSANSITVNENTVILMNQGLNNTGMRIFGVDYSDFDCNIIGGANAFVFNQNEFGINVNNSDHNKFSCNSVFEVSRGVRFANQCLGTDLIETTFFNNDIGLHMTAQANLGQVQDNTGNQWFGTSTNTGALHQTNNQLLINSSRFFVRELATPLISNPPPSTPALPNSNWFTLDPLGVTSNACFATGTTCPAILVTSPLVGNGNNLSYMMAVAQGTLTYPEYQEAKQWRAKRYLFEKLSSENMEEIDEPVLNTFYNNAMNSNIGALYEMDIEIGNLHKIPAETSETLSQLNSSIKNLMTDVNQIDLENLNDYQDWQQHFEDKAPDRASLTQLIGEKNALQNQIKEEQRTKAAVLLQLNNQLASTEIYESNTKEVYDIYLRYIANGEELYPANDIVHLNFIAEQCPIAGGKAVYMARRILTAFYPELTWDDDINCTNDQSAEEVENRSTDIDANSEEVSLKKLAAQVELFPNPAQSTFHIRLPNSDQPFTVVITNILGKEQFSLRNIESGQHSIETNEWNAGIYWVEIFIDDEILSTRKLIVVE